ncbi:MAG: oxidoreductase [Actinomycetota bacterium]
MQVAVVGAGPAGLYFAVLMARTGGYQVTVFERNPKGATYGWGVVFSEGTLSELAEIDHLTYLDLERALVRWSTIDIYHRGERIRSTGHPFSAISRRTLLSVLARRAVELGVDIRYQQPVEPPDVLDGGFDLVVAADGVNSLMRETRRGAFSPRFDVHPTRYIWLGLPRPLPAFTFIFEETPFGLFQVHGYPYDASGSTFIVETATETWRQAGLHEANEAESLAFCEKVFGDHLAGEQLHSNRSSWTAFVTLRSRSWFDLDGPGPPLVLMGDAAHTAHFSIGSGTKLAMEDAASLYRSLAAHPLDPAAALPAYQADRQPPVARFQDAARDSAGYFEGVRDVLDLPPETFAFNLLTRSGRVTHLDMQRRDPALTMAADRWAASVVAGEVVPPPAMTRLEVGGLMLANRLVGRLGDLPGPGLLMTTAQAVSDEGRFHPGQPTVAAPGWTPSDLTPSLIGVVLSHAGPRASCRAPEDGLDRPLGEGDWDTVACSALSYTPSHPPSRPAGSADLAAVADAFVDGARWAAEVGAQLLVVDAARGGFLAGFFSPLTNHRRDDYGGDISQRVRYPLEVVGAVREVWRGPLAVAFSATDWAKGGTTPPEAVAIAASLKGIGVDMVEICGGGTVVDAEPDYRRGYLLSLATLVRNRVRLPVLVGGGFWTLDDVNTAVAGGRADLLYLNPYLYRRVVGEPYAEMGGFRTAQD